MTPIHLKVLNTLEIRAKGLPVGIPTPPRIARRFIQLGYAEYAPCGYLHLLKRKLYPIRLTAFGQAQLNISRL